MAHFDGRCYWDGLGITAKTYLACRHNMEKSTIEKKWHELPLADQCAIRKAVAWELGVMC